jgi:hypothetical protein
MATRIHRPLNVVAFNANGIGRQRYEVSKQLQEQRIDVALISDTHLKPHERFYIPNYQVNRTGRTAELPLQLNKASPITM